MSETDVVEVPRALLDRLLNRVDELEVTLDQYRSENERDKATIRQDIHEAIEKAESSRREAEVDEPVEESLGSDAGTPMERLIQLGEQGVMADVTASVRRAKAIAQHFGQ